MTFEHIMKPRGTGSWRTYYQNIWKATSAVRGANLTVSTSHDYLLAKTANPTTGWYPSSSSVLLISRMIEREPSNLGAISWTTAFSDPRTSIFSSCRS
jgi:hypothetical protein